MKQIEIRRKQIEYLTKAVEILLFLMIKKKLGLEGSGFFLVPLMLFTMFWPYFGETLPDALARLIRVRRNKGQYKSVKSIRWYAFLCQFVMGAIGTFLMLTLGSFLGERVFGCTYAGPMIWILSPLLFLRGISNLFLGYFQGEGFELPGVVSCVLRVIAIYAFGMILGGVSGEYGSKVSALLKGERYVGMYAGEGWCLGILMAELLVILVLFVFFLGMKGKKRNGDFEAVKDTASLPGYVSAVFQNKIYVSMVLFLEQFPVFMGMTLYYKRVGAKAPVTYGTFFVGYLAVCIFLVRLISALAVPYWPKVGGFFRQDDVRLGRVCFHGGIHLILSLSSILAAGVSAMASQVGALAGFTSPDLVKVVVQGSALIPFLCLAFYFSRILMRFKKSLLVIGMGILSDVLFVMIFSMMWSDEKHGLLALTYAGLISVGVYAVLLGAIAIQLVGGRMNWLKDVVIPLFLAVAAGILQALCVKFVGDKLESLYVVLLVGAGGFVVYWCALLYLRNFTEEELSVMPGGNVILSFGKMLGIY